MGHNICAIIGKKPINETKVREFQLAVAYENDYAMVILEMDSIFYWSEKLNLSFESESENINWACELSFYFAKELGLEKYAIIQTNYFAGIGDQSASLYIQGKPIIVEESINKILAELGVIRTDTRDEFEILKLFNYRSIEKFYWDTFNQAENRNNMIPGRIPKDIS